MNTFFGLPRDLCSCGGLNIVSEHRIQVRAGAGRRSARAELRASIEVIRHEYAIELGSWVERGWAHRGALGFSGACSLGGPWRRSWRGTRRGTRRRSCSAGTSVLRAARRVQSGSDAANQGAGTGQCGYGHSPHTRKRGSFKRDQHPFPGPRQEHDRNFTRRRWQGPAASVGAAWANEHDHGYRRGGVCWRPATPGVPPVSHTGLTGNGYTYGYGAGARPYRAYGYGSGYRNRYYGRRYGYGRSQGNNRAIVSRLRSVQMQLARIDHDYQGHRVRAMHQVSMAIRQLSHRSMIYSGVGFAPGTNNGMGMGMGMGRGGMGGRAGLGNAGGNGGRGGAGRMSQAQSDARMSHSLRTLQGVNMQLGSQASSSNGHARARGHVMQAVRELNVALSIR